MQRGTYSTGGAAILLQSPLANASGIGALGCLPRIVPTKQVAFNSPLVVAQQQMTRAWLLDT